MADSIIALDVGSTACKGSRLRPDGTVETQISFVYPDLAAGHDPHAWWRALRTVISRLHARPRSSPAAVCLCGRGADIAFLDADGQPLDVPWADTLARARTRPVPPGLSMRAARWAAVYLALREISPRIADRVARVCGVKDYLNLRLTGEWATDPSSAGGFAWPRDTGAYGLRPEMLPPIRRADETLGGVRGCARVAVSSGTPVFVGSHDGVCANIGAGMLAVGEGCVTLGTHAVLRVNTSAPVVATPALAAFTYPYLDGTWTSGGDVVHGGAAAMWVARLLGLRSRSPDHGLSRLDALADAAPAGANGLVFVPYLAGTVSPHYAPALRGRFVGVAASHGPQEFARAVLEGTAFALRHIRDAFLARGGRIERLSVTGGGARSRVWLAIVASVLDAPFEHVDAEASSRGAAVLAAAGLRRYPSVASASRAMARSTGSVAPRATWAAVYGPLYQRYRAECERLVHAIE